LALAFERQQGVSLGYWAAAALTVPILLQLFSLSSPVQARQAEGGKAPAEADELERRSEVGRSGVLLLAVFLFFYVGVEVGYGGWLYTYGLKLNLESEVSGAYLTSVFWGTFTLGRLLSVPLSDRLSPGKMLVGDLAVGSGALLILSFLPPGTWLTRILTVILGLALASVFPSTLALAGKGQELSARAASWFFVSGGLGAVVLPWLIGVLISKSGPAAFPNVLLASCLAGTCVLIVYLVRTQSGGVEG
jgi:FHS family Na+ dependent glucose MFS transporter 1